MKRILRTIFPRARLYRVIYTLLTIYMLYYLLRLLKPFIPKERFRHLLKRLDEHNARRLYKTILRLKGLFIKVGQFMSMRVDLLPRAYTSTLSKLQDQVPAMEFSLIRSRLEDELKKPLEEIFSEFATEPIAAASLGQVHRARIRDGKIVAVKVQYPNIEKIVEKDLQILRIILAWYGFWRKALDYKKILGEFQNYILQELDYIHEGQNAERIARLMSDRREIIIPSVIWELTTKRVLVLEFVEGIKITDVEKYEALGIDRHSIMEIVLDCYFRLIFKEGFFQADPHPGNLFVLPGHRLCMVDFGLATEISREKLMGFGRIALGVVNQNPDMLAEGLRSVGFIMTGDSRKSLKGFAELIVKYAPEVVYKKPKDIDFQGLFNEILSVIQDNPIVHLPSDFILMGRVLGLLSGLGRQLKARVRVEKVIMPYIMEGITDS